MKLTQGGYLGIGTNNPESKFQVVETIPGTHLNVNIYHTDPDTNSILQVQNGGDGTGDPQIALTTKGESPYGDWTIFLDNDDSQKFKIGTGFQTVTPKLTIETGGNIGIGTTSPSASAKLEIDSTTGSLLLPRMTEAERDALTPTNGMIIYSTTNNRFEGYENGGWVDL